MDTITRSNLTKVALEAYRTLKHNRAYALTSDSQNVLAAFAAAIVQKRAAEDRTNSDNPTVREEIVQLIQALSNSGCNVLQVRPSDAPPTPRPWVDPVSGEQLRNPFAKGSEDLKAQSILERRDPALAKHLKSMAADPYGTIAALIDAEVERQSLSSVPYDESIHKLNPFAGDNKTLQSEFVRKDPMLAAFYREEAKPVEIPVFGARKNLTIEGRLIRDPQAAAVLRVAKAIQRQWLEADRQQAIEQRAAAQKEIERLQAQAGA
jgi:hypothetical protein